MAKPPNYPHGIAAAFPKSPEPPKDDDPTLTPGVYLHRQQVARKGRGAVTNLRGRYETVIREEFDDGWQAVAFMETSDDTGDQVAAAEDPQMTGEYPANAENTEALPPLKTIVTTERAKSIISRNTSPDLPFNQSLNPYRGCEHGCIYCFARPSHSYLGLSPGLDFESRLFAKTNAPELLLREFARPAYVPETITVGINTDAYQPCERELKITRQLLQIFHDCQHPVALITKSSLIERDIDLLGAHGGPRASHCRRHHYHSRSENGAHSGAARGHANASLACDQDARRSRHSGERLHCTGDSVRDRA